jgi:hypothetical protein
MDCIFLCALSNLVIVRMVVFNCGPEIPIRLGGNCFELIINSNCASPPVKAAAAAAGPWQLIASIACFFILRVIIGCPHLLNLTKAFGAHPQALSFAPERA